MIIVNAVRYYRSLGWESSIFSCCFILASLKKHYTSLLPSGLVYSKNCKYKPQQNDQKFISRLIKATLLSCLIFFTYLQPFPFSLPMGCKVLLLVSKQMFQQAKYWIINLKVFSIVHWYKSNHTLLKTIRSHVDNSFQLSHYDQFSFVMVIDRLLKSIMVA